MLIVREKTNDKKENHQTQKYGKLNWINCAKALAIIAVLVDHSTGILYTNYVIKEALIWHVSMFIFVSGFTSYMSQSRSQMGWLKAYLRSIKRILEAYIICSAICLVIKTHGFDFREYVNQLIHFSASLPLYFVALYLQLMFVSKPLFYVLQKCSQNKRGYIHEGLLLCIIVCIASITTNHTQIADLYGGGGKVLGGTFLIVFYLGMLMAKHGCFIKTFKMRSIFIWLLSSIGWLFWYNNISFIRDKIDYKLYWLGTGYEIPNIAIMGLTFLTIFAIYGACKILEGSKFTQRILGIFSWLGEHTLYVFMLHATILYYCVIPYFVIDNIWLKRIVYMTLMIIVPIMIEYILNAVMNRIIILGKWIKVKKN